MDSVARSSGKRSRHAIALQCAAELGRQRVDTHQKCTVLGPTGEAQNLAKPVGSAPAVDAWRRA